MGTSHGVVHREVLELRAIPAQVRGFIMIPERILEYFPGAIEAGVFEDGRSIWCRGEMGVSMLERIEDESSDDCVVIFVTIATGLDPPYTPEGIKAATLHHDGGGLGGGGNPGRHHPHEVVALCQGDPAITLPAQGRHPRDLVKGESESLVEKWNEVARAWPSTVMMP